MLSLLLQEILFRSVSAAVPAIRRRKDTPNVAQDLMESAGARSGTNPYQSAELRGAALAFLSVMR